MKIIHYVSYFSHIQFTHANHISNAAAPNPGNDAQGKRLNNDSKCLALSPVRSSHILPSRFKYAQQAIPSKIWSICEFSVLCIDFALHIAYNISASAMKGVDRMATTTNFSVRMDKDIKKQCEALYGELGVNLTTAINVFLRQSLRVGGFPFDIRIEQPNKETMAAMLEAERIGRDPSVKRYSNVEEALRALKE